MAGTGGINNRQWCYTDDGKEVWVSRAELDEFARSGVLKDDTLVGWDGLPGAPFTIRGRDAAFFYVHRGTTCPVATASELDAAYAEGRITRETAIYGPRLPGDGVPYKVLADRAVRIAPPAADFLAARLDFSHTILVGRNNVGKSLILKELRQHLGAKGSLLLANRFYHFDQVGQASDRLAQHTQRYDHFVQSLYQSQNQEASDVQVQQIIGWMKDAQRNLLWSICSDLLGEPFSLERNDPENELSAHHVRVGGRNLAVASSGTRLLLGIVAACLDDAMEVLLIDEPELGLSPALQQRLARFLMSSEVRALHFPHLRHVFIATHSHLFLDRLALQNNFIVTKQASQISVRQIENLTAFHETQFDLLGNHLETLFFPAAIVIVEGITDQSYIRALLRDRFPDRTIAVVNAKGDGNTTTKLHTISEAMGGLLESPYRTRVFVLLDQTNSLDMRRLVLAGVPEQNITILKKNGIEHYYPAGVLAGIFRCEPSLVLDSMKITSACVECNGKRFGKTALNDEVMSRMRPNMEVPSEINEGLFEPLDALLKRSQD